VGQATTFFSPSQRAQNSPHAWKHAFLSAGYCAVQLVPGGRVLIKASRLTYIAPKQLLTTVGAVTSVLERYLYNAGWPSQACHLCRLHNRVNALGSTLTGFLV